MAIPPDFDIRRSYTEFILGVRDIDDNAVWQAYLNELNDMGLERYLEVCDEYYFGN